MPFQDFAWAGAAVNEDGKVSGEYEGLDVGHAVYEWDYARQLIELRILEATERLDRA